MGRSRFLTNRAGFTATELLVVATIVGGVSSAAFVNVKDKAKQTECQNNLKQISMALRMHEMTSGKLPKADFFPDDPKKGKDSIRVILKGYPAKLFVCPSTPEEISKKGLTFLWNDKCSGKPSHRIKKAGKTWLLIEINAVSDKVPAPHPGGYNILYADLQTVKAEKELPKDLAEGIETKSKESEEKK